MEMIHTKTLPNGLRIVGEKMENYRSVSVGCWVRAGSVNERVGRSALDGAGSESGISHFIEHMLFKGTLNRGADEIAEQIDMLGGNLNAFTSKECTCFYAKVIGENIDSAIELIADLVCRSRIDDADIEREKGVVLEEIAMNEDSPEDLAHEALCSLYLGGDPLSNPVLGTEKSVSALKRDMILSYMARRYRPENIVIAAAGNFEMEQLCLSVEKHFEFSGTGFSADESGAHEVDAAQETKKLLLIEKDIEQTHIALAFPGFASETKQQYPLLMLNNIVGGSVSSRLFQNVREKLGLAYSIYSAPTFFTTGGYFTLYAGTGEKQAQKVLELMLEECENLKKHGVSAAELERSKLQTKTSFILGGESTASHASKLGRNTLFGKKQLSDDEVIKKIECVSEDDINAILYEVFDFERMRAVAVGRTEKYAASLEKQLLMSK